MAKKLFVGGLPYSTTKEELENAFAKFGAVDEAIIIDKNDMGRRRFFAFVTMTNDAEAEAAVSSLNGSDFGGRSITVNEARPMTERPPRRDRGSYDNRGGYDNRGSY